jgi:uroporphyrinogen decarboxylase
MISRQRVLAALNSEEPDKIPIVESIDVPIQIKLGQILGLDIADLNTGFQSADLNCQLVEALGLDWVDSYPRMGKESINETHIRDKYGCVFILSEHGQAVPVQGPIRENSDLQKFDMTSRLTPEDLDDTNYTVEKLGNEKACVLFCADPFKISWTLRGGMQNLLMDFMLNPTLVHDLARIATDFNLALIEMASGIGVDIIFLGGDLASEENTLMSPEHYRDYVKPYHKEMVDFTHKQGLHIVKHSDGNMWPILDELIEIGFDAFHPIQPDCMDIGEVKKHVDGKLCLIGNIDCRDLLCSGTQEEVVAAVKQTIEVAAPGGGFMMMSSNSIHPGVNPDNYLAMVSAAHKYGVYR